MMTLQAPLPRCFGIQSRSKLRSSTIDGCQLSLGARCFGKESIRQLLNATRFGALALLAFTVFVPVQPAGAHVYATNLKVNDGFTNVQGASGAGWVKTVMLAK